MAVQVRFFGELPVVHAGREGVVTGRRRVSRRAGQRPPGALDLGPGHVEGGIAQTVNTRFQRLRSRLAGAVQVPELVALPEQEVEAEVVRAARCHAGEIGARRLVATQEVGGEFAAGARRAPGDRIRVADVRNRGESPLIADSQPRAPGLEVTARDHPRRIAPA